MATPTEIIADARRYAGDLIAKADTALGDAIGAVEWAGAPYVGTAWANLPAPPSQFPDLTAPTLGDITLDLPSEPTAALNFQDIPAFAEGTEPTLSATAPTLTLPTAPSQLAQFASTIPALNLAVQFPSAPSLILPEAPSLPVRSEPAAPQTVLPAFEGAMPNDLPAAPADLQGSFSAAYRDAAPSTITMVNGYVDAMLAKNNPRYAEQMGAIENQLSRYLAGGTGMQPEVEDAIYSRAREKNDVEAARVRSAAYLEAASRGFTLPSGALLSAVARARQDAANNNVKASSDIVVMQAEMEQKNLQFAVTASIGLRKAMLDASLSYMQNLGQLNGQALDYAKSMLGAIVEVYNASVKAFSVKLEAYKAEASVFEVRMRSAMLGIEVYKAEISALQSLTQVDLSRVEVYKARIESLTSMTAMYRTQVEAAVSKASLEKLKIELFSSQVQAYSAQVSAKNSEWAGYSAAIGGEQAKSQMFGAQVQAYGAQVQGYKAVIEAKSEVVRAAALTNDARARQYTAAMTGYQTVVQAMGEVARTKLENQRQEIIAFQAESQAAVANAQVEAEFYKSTGMISIENAKLALQSIIANAEVKTNHIKVLSTLHTANATIHGNLAGAAMAGMNSLASSTETI